MRIATVVALAITLASPAARALDEGLYATILERHTVAVDDIASTRVDYRALRTSEPWEALLRTLRESHPSGLRSRNEKIAFWINAYNILAIDLVRRHYPIDSIRSIGSFFSPVWTKAAGEIGGRPYTLHEIEHEILRSMREPRMHAAIVCASLSCPPLRREPYTAAALDAQLEDNVRRWLADPRKGARIDRSARTLHLSPILKWFAADFGENVLVFVAAYLPAEDSDWIRAQGRMLRIDYFDYDWRVNDAAASSPLARARPGQVVSQPRGACRLRIGLQCSGMRPLVLRAVIGLKPGERRTGPGRGVRGGRTTRSAGADLRQPV